MATAHRNRTGWRAALAGAALGALLGAGGCESGTGGGRIDSPAQRDVDRAAARALAMNAQRAEKAGEVDRAISMYREAIETDPSAPAQWWNNLGALLMGKQPPDYVNASVAFRAAAALDLTDPRPRVNLGMVYYEAKHDAKALEAFEEALALDRNDLNALRAAVRSQKRMLRVDQASLERAQRGLMIESDPVWRDIFLRERIRVESRLESLRTNAAK